jgi:L-cysteate sulfo-lyase
VGASNALGALGYARAALEIRDQLEGADLDVSCLVTASGSAGTQAGLLVGLLGAEPAIPVLGICVSRPGAEQEEKVWRLAGESADLLGIPDRVPRHRVVAIGDFVGDGYGIPTEGMVEAVGLVARTEGLLLDPVYSGKAMAGLIGLIRQGRFGRDENVLFLHTGGTPGLFAYADALG